MQGEAHRSSVEFRVEVVLNGLEISHSQMPVAIANVSRISLLRRVKARLKPKIVEIGIENALAVVVINLSSIKYCVVHRQLEDAGVATAASLRLRQVANTLSVHYDAHHWMIYLEIPDIPLPTEDRSDADSHADMVHNQQWRIGMGARAADDNAVQVEPERKKTKSEILHVHRRPQRGLHLALRKPKRILTEGTATRKENNRDDNDGDEYQKPHPNSSCNFFQLSVGLPAPSGHELWFVFFLLGIERVGKATQNACPNVMKNCVDLIPGAPLRLWPISIRMGPTGVL